MQITREFATLFVLHLKDSASQTANHLLSILAFA